MFETYFLLWIAIYSMQKLFLPWLTNFIDHLESIWNTKKKKEKSLIITMCNHTTYQLICVGSWHVHSLRQFNLRISEHNG